MVKQRAYNRIGGGADLLGWLVLLVFLYGHRELSVDLVSDPVVLVTLIGIGMGAYAYSGRQYAYLVLFIGGLGLGLFGVVLIFGTFLAIPMLLCAVIALGSSVLGIVTSRRN